MRVIGIDQSFTSTAFTILDEGDLTPVHMGLIQSKPNTFANTPSRIEWIAEKLSESIREYEPQRLFIEHYSIGSRGRASKDLSGLFYGLLIIMKRRTHLTYEDMFSYMPTTIKKYATGNGRADKKDMVEALPEPIRTHCKGTYKVSKGLYDIADSYHIARMGINHE